jgi:hypothetical protein
VTTVETAAFILVTATAAVSVVVMFGLFVWAARKDGEEDRAVQRRLGIRRRTRLGR